MEFGGATRFTNVYKIYKFYKEGTAGMKDIRLCPQMEISHTSTGRTFRHGMHYRVFHVLGEGNASLYRFSVMFPVCNSANTLL